MRFLILNKDKTGEDVSLNDNQNEILKEIHEKIKKYSILINKPIDEVKTDLSYIIYVSDELEGSEMSIYYLHTIKENSYNGVLMKKFGADTLDELLKDVNDYCLKCLNEIKKGDVENVKINS